jgi:hypothetical protein
MGAVLLTSVELQAPHWIFGLPCELISAAAKNESWRMERMENISSGEEGLSLCTKKAALNVPRTLGQSKGLESECPLGLSYN